MPALFKLILGLFGLYCLKKVSDKMIEKFDGEVTIDTDYVKIKGRSNESMQHQVSQIEKLEVLEVKALKQSLPMLKPFKNYP